MWIGRDGVFEATYFNLIRLVEKLCVDRAE